MKSTFAVSTALLSLLVTGIAVADDDCSDPVSDWQPREALRQQVERYGWTVQRIKVDDGCYEVKGLDRRGNKIEASYAPSSLSIRKLHIDFGDGGDVSDYLVPQIRTQ